MKEKKLTFRQAIVWLTAIEVLIPNGEEMLKGGQWVVYFSFTEPSGIAYGESIKGDGGHTMLFRSADDALDYAEIFLSYLK